MYKYIYKHKKTGKKIYSNRPLDDDDLELISERKNTKMGSGDILEKSNKGNKSTKKISYDRNS